EVDDLGLDVAVVVGDAHREAVGAVEVGRRGVAPGAGGGIDRRAAVAGGAGDGEIGRSHAVGCVADGQRAGDRAGVLVAAAAGVAAEAGRVVDLVDREVDDLGLDVAVVVGDAHREAVGAVEVGRRGVAPGAGGGIDRRAAVAGGAGDGEIGRSHAVGCVADGQRAGDRAGVLVAAAAGVAAEA